MLYLWKKVKTELTTAVVTKPEVKLSAQRSEVSVEVSKVTDADGCSYRTPNATTAELNLQEGAAAEGDTVVIDFTARFYRRC